MGERDRMVQVLWAEVCLRRDKAVREQTEMVRELNPWLAGTHRKACTALWADNRDTLWMRPGSKDMTWLHLLIQPTLLC